MRAGITENIMTTSPGDIRKEMEKNLVPRRKAVAWRKTWRKTGLRWLKFNAVGGIGIAVQLVLLLGLKAGFHLNYLLATALAVEAAVVHNLSGTSATHGRIVQSRHGGRRCRGSCDST